MTGWGTAALGTLFARAATLVMTMCSGVLLARQLAPAGRGTYYVLLSVAIMSYFLGNLSVDQAMVSRWQHAAERPALRANSLVLGPVLGSIAALAAGTVAVTSGAVGTVTSSEPFLLAIVLLTVPVNVTCTYVSGVLSLEGRIRLVTWGSFGGSATQFVMLAFCSATGSLDIATAVFIWMLSVVVPLALFLGLGRFSVICRDARLAVRAVMIGLRNHLGLVAVLLLMRVDVLMVNTLASPAAAGLFSVAVTLVDLVSVATLSLSLVGLARQADQDISDAARVTATATRLAGLVGVVAMAVLCLAAPVLIPVVYGPEFADSAVQVFGLAPGFLVYAATRPIWTHLLRLDRPGKATGIALLAFALNAVLAVALIPVMGVLGCAIASSIAFACFTAMQTVWFLRATGLPITSVVPGPAELRAVAGALARVRQRLEAKP